MEMGRARRQTRGQFNLNQHFKINMSSHQEHSQQPHENTNASNPQHSQKPYWKRAHRDWRIWVLVVLMIGCMGIYLMTGDLRWPFFGSRQAMVPIAN